MTKTRAQILQESKKKGLQTAALAGAAIAVGVVSATPLIGMLVAIPAAISGVRWWKHRAENGIKF